MNCWYLTEGPHSVGPAGIVMHSIVSNRSCLDFPKKRGHPIAEHSSLVVIQSEKCVCVGRGGGVETNQILEAT